MAKRAKKTAVDETVEASTDAVETTKKGSTTMTDKNQILELDMNLDEFEDFVPLPKGEYPATVLEAEMRTSDKGNDYYYVVFQIHPDDYPVDYDIANGPEGLRLTWARTQKPDPKNRRSITGAKNLIRAIGGDLKSSIINPGDWEGKKAKLVVSNSEWQGELRTQIDRVEALD